MRITRPFYLGTYHVTRGQFRQFVADTEYKTDAEKGEKPGASGWNPDKKKFELQREVFLAEHGFRADRRAPGGQRKLERRGGLLQVAQPQGRQDLPAADGGRVGIRLPCRDDNAVFQRRRSRDAGKVGNVADAAFKAKFPDWKGTIKASDGYAFTAPVGSFQPNAFGLYDMHGNAWQWCADRYGEDYYATSPADDPAGPDSGEFHVVLRRFLVQRADRTRVPPNAAGSCPPTGSISRGSAWPGRIDTVGL